MYNYYDNYNFDNNILGGCMEFNKIKYEIIKNEKDAIDVEIMKEKVTEYFTDFEYIVGDWAYGKLRLKGFYDKSNKNCKEFNDIKNLDKYVEEKCAYGCKYFVIKKV